MEQKLGIAKVREVVDVGQDFLQKHKRNACSMTILFALLCLIASDAHKSGTK